MKAFPLLRRVALLAGFALTARAYVLYDIPAWPDGEVPLVYRLGAAPAYEDGETPDSTAALAAATWNNFVGRIQFEGTTKTAGQPAEDNGENDLFFADDIYGEAFGEGVLAVTVLTYDETARTETDIVVNSNEPWDAYRGPLRLAEVDLRRVLLHELGHLLGLGHPDEDGQWADAVMNSTVSWIEAPTADDQTGAATLYGPGSLSVQPWIIEHPSDLHRHEGQSASFHVSVSGPVEFTYQWFKDGEIIPGAENFTLLLEAVSMADAGDYHVVVSAATGSVSSGAVTLTVDPAEPPTITTAPQSTTVEEEAHVILSVEFSGSEPFTFQWFKNGAAIPEATNAWLSIERVLLADAGDYSVTVSNIAGEETSAAARLVVRPLAAPPVLDYGNRAATAGNDVYFSSWWSSASALYQWYKDGEPVPGADSFGLLLPAYSASDVGEYVLAVTNRSGTTVSRASWLSVAVPPPPTGSWTNVQRVGEIVYFLFASPARIERFNLESRTFIEPISLPSAPNAMRVSAESLYLAFGRSVSRYELDGSDQRILFNVPEDIRDVVLAGHLLYAVYGYSPIYFQPFIIASETLGPLQNMWDDLGSEPSYSSEHQSLFAADYYSRIRSLQIGSDGGFGASHGADTTVPVGQRTFLFPAQDLIVDDGGSVHRTSDLAYVGSIGACGDLDFTSDGSLISVHGTTVVEFAASLREVGRYELAEPAERLFVHGDDIVAFRRVASAAAPIGWERIERSALLPREPAPVRDPRQVVIQPSAVMLDREGVVLLLDRLNRQIHRWSIATRDFLDSVPLEGAPNFFAYSSETHRAYLGYADQRINEIRFEEDLVEMSFSRAPGLLSALLGTGDRLLLVDGSNTWPTHYLVDTSGALVTDDAWRWSSTEFAWDPIRRRVYQFNNRLIYSDVPADGPLGPQQSGSYDSNLEDRHAMSISATGDLILLGNGRIYSADTLEPSAALGNEVDDAAWLDETPFTARFMAAGAELQRWGGANYVLDKERTYSGRPLRLLALPEERLLLLTQEGARLTFRILDRELELLSEDSNLAIPSERLVNLSVRGHVGGEDVLVAGFGLRGPGHARIIARGVGPTLSTLDLETPNANPKLEVRRVGTDVLLADNDQWHHAYNERVRDFEAVGAFALDPESNDAAARSFLEEGGYTAVAAGQDGAEGVVLLELYHRDNRGEAIRPVSLSARGTVRSGEGALIAGFVIRGSEPRQVLIRAVGPSLADLDAEEVLTNPMMTVYDRDREAIATNDDWEDTPELATATVATGALALLAGSADAALLLTLDPGEYTAVVHGVDEAEGIALVEVYDVDAAQE